jgi:hypothetical protein
MRDTLVGLAFVALGLLVALTFWLVYVNRGSEKVISAALPIAIAAVVGVFLTVFAFANEPDISKAFPVTFFYRAENATPVSPPFRRNHNDVFLAARLLKDDPSKANDGTGGSLLYHHLLQKALFEWIAFKHAGAWDSEHLSFDAGTKMFLSGPVRGRAEPSLKIERKTIEEILSGNWFASSAGMPLGLTVPVGTKVTIRPPGSSSGGMIESEIRFSNPVCTLTITTTPIEWGGGLGAYQTFTALSIDEAQKLYKHATYTVRGVVSFKRYRVGDPSLPLIKRWATQILDGLQSEFDEQIVYRETRDNFILAQASGPGGLAGKRDVYGFNP